MVVHSGVPRWFLGVQPIRSSETLGRPRRERSRTRGRSARLAWGGYRGQSRVAAVASDNAPGVVRLGPGSGMDMLREEPDCEVTNEPDGPLFPTVEGHDLILILRIAHQVEGGCGAGEPTPVKDLVGGRVEVA